MRYNQFGTYMKYTLMDSFLQSYELHFDRKVETVNLFIDLQNCLKGQYYEDFILESYNSVVNKERYSPIVYDTIHFLARTRSYFQTKNIRSRFIIYWDSGKSLYHTSIDKKYKSSRSVKSTTLPIEVFDTGLDVIKFQKKLLNKIAANLDDVYVIFLKNIETDFIPHAILRYHENLREDKSQLNFLLSADKDLFQTLTLSDNIYQYVKYNSNWIDIVSPKKIIDNLVKKEYGDELVNYFMVLFSLGGDGGDDIPSVFPRKRYLSLYRLVKEYKDDFKNILYTMVYEEQFKKVDISKSNSTHKKLLSMLNDDELIRQRWVDNYLLMSFDAIYDFVNDKIKNPKLKHLTAEYKNMIKDAYINVFNENKKIDYNELVSIMNYCHDMESLDPICSNLCEVKNNVDQGRSS